MVAGAMILGPSDGDAQAGLPAGGPSSSPGAIRLVAPSSPSPETLADGRAIGRKDAPATLTVWEDFQCPVCGQFTRLIEPKLFSDYVVPGKLRIVYKDDAFIGQESTDAAAAARCAGDQGKFWPYHDYLFWNQSGENRGAFSRDRLDAIADAVELNRTTFDACLAAGQAAALVSAETASAAQAGVTETPTLIVDKQVMAGAPLSDLQYEALGNVIKASIAAHSSAAP